MAIYTIIETKGLEKISVGYFNGYDEIMEFLNKKEKEYIEKDFFVSHRRFKKGKIVYYGLRNKKRKSEFVSYSILKLTNNDSINECIIGNNPFGELHSHKRRQYTIWLSEEEINLLDKIAKKYKVNKAMIIRASIFNTFKKDLEKLGALSEK